MSIVEKAAERLKALRVDSPPPPAIEPVPPPVAPPTDGPPARHVAAIERLQERSPREDHAAASAPPPSAPPPPWHVDLRALEKVGWRSADGKDDDSRLADELRRIKRPLLDNVNGKGAQAAPAHAARIMVTSAVPREGKTFTAVNLALSLARNPDFEVLLVDGDVPKCDITHVLGLDGRPGLMDVLVDEKRHPAEVVVRTDVPNLLLAPAGARHPLAAELFGSLRMEYVLQELGGHNRRRLIVFDSSPLLATSESPALASHMGQVVVVVAADHTRRHAVDSALRTLDDNAQGESQYVGLVLNKSRLPASEDHYDGSYGYHPADREGVA